MSPGTARDAVPLPVLRNTAVLVLLVVEVLCVFNKGGGATGLDRRLQTHDLDIPDTDNVVESYAKLETRRVEVAQGDG